MARRYEHNELTGVGAGVTVGVGVDTVLAVSLILLCGGAIGAAALSIQSRRLLHGEQIPLGAAILAAGVTCFGGAGILALRLFGFGPGKGLLAAGLFAALSMALFGALARLARAAAARRAALDELVGGLAAVVVAIEPGAMGAVATRSAPAELTLAAISTHPAPLPVGTTVVVTALRAGRGGEAVEVVPLPPSDGGLAEAAS